jgi:hypothetical protein
MSLPASKFARARDIAFTPATPQQVADAEEHPGLGIREWLDLQAKRLGPVGKIARGENMPDDAREMALSKVAKEYQTYQLLCREYQARRGNISRNNN